MSEPDEEKYTAIASKAESDVSWFSRILGRKNLDYYCIYPDEIYVRTYAVEDADSTPDTNFSYFVIDTEIAVGSIGVFQQSKNLAPYVDLRHKNRGLG